MSTGKGILGHWESTGEEIRQALGEAIYAALREYKKAGVSAVTMRDGKIVLVPPDQIVVPDDESEGLPSTTRNASSERHSQRDEVPATKAATL